MSNNIMQTFIFSFPKTFRQVLDIDISSDIIYWSFTQNISWWDASKSVNLSCSPTIQCWTIIFRQILFIDFLHNTQTFLVEMRQNRWIWVVALQYSRREVVKKIKKLLRLTAKEFKISIEQSCIASYFTMIYLSSFIIHN